MRISLAWENPCEVVALQRVPCSAFVGRGHSQYVRDRVLTNAEKPEYESVSAFIQAKTDDEDPTYDWQDLTALVCSESSSVDAVREQLRIAGFSLRTYRPKGCGETRKEYRDRLRGENEMANRIQEFALVTSAVASELPEASRDVLVAVLRRVNGSGFASYVENLTGEAKASALVEVAAALVNAGRIAEAKNAILEAKGALDEAREPASPAAIAAAKAAALAKAAQKAAQKAQILRAFEQK